MIPAASVRLTNLDEKTNRETVSNAQGTEAGKSAPSRCCSPVHGTVTVARSKWQANGAREWGGSRPELIGNPDVATGGPIWNANAFALVPKGAGRYGDEGVGVVEGPGTIAVAAGLSKYFSLFEQARIRFEATFTNALNHPNFAVPAAVLTAPSTFGILTTVQSAENSGNRVGRLSLRVEF